MGLDWRNIENGRVIPSENYADQPYVVQTADGAWLCVMTTGAGLEGQAGQHIITTRSLDQGRTWSEPVDVEPADGPEASYAVLAMAPMGRVFCFYNHNTDNLRTVAADQSAYAGGFWTRVDSLGHHCYRYSDDYGKTWSETRYEIPIRETEIDCENPYGGAIRFFWNVGRPVVIEDSVLTSLHKIGRFGRGGFVRSEGVLLKSDDLLSLDDPGEAHWETLPDGEVGLRAPAGGGLVAEEQSYSLLSDGSLFCVYRTIDGHPAHAYSRDGGHTWSAPAHLRYADGHLVKHPRAANFCWRCGNGRYLYWYHNHGGRWYEDRNPVWLCAGREVERADGLEIAWSQPEILLYADHPDDRMSYPDLIEEDGAYFVTETQKTIARIHPIDSDLLDGLWQQEEHAEVVQKGLLLDWRSDGARECAAPELPPLRTARGGLGGRRLDDLGGGLTFELWLEPAALTSGTVLADCRDSQGKGWAIVVNGRGSIELVLNDGRRECRWDTDPDVVSAGGRHHVVAMVDGGPKLILFIVDGRLCDGGDARQYGWGRYDPFLREVNGGDRLRVDPTGQSGVAGLRIYGRCLRVSEAISNYRAGLD